jgi:hypothetical protein
LPFILPPRGSGLPPPGSRARLPFLLVPVLTGMAVLQLAFPERIELPPGGSVARIDLAAQPMVTVPAQLATRDLFTPPAKTDRPDGPSDPLDGAVIAGVVQKGRLRLGIVHLASGAVRYVAVGGAVAGWRLASLDQAQARLTRGHGQHLRVAYGAHPTTLNISSTLVKTEDGQ